MVIVHSYVCHYQRVTFWRVWRPIPRLSSNHASHLMASAFATLNGSRGNSSVIARYISYISGWWLYNGYIMANSGYMMVNDGWYWLMIWLVKNPSETYEFASWDNEIPNWMEKQKNTPTRYSILEHWHFAWSLFFLRSPGEDPQKTGESSLFGGQKSSQSSSGFIDLVRVLAGLGRPVETSLQGDRPPQGCLLVYNPH